MTIIISRKGNRNTAKITSVKEMWNKRNLIDELKREVETGGDFIVFIEWGGNEGVSWDI
jgi:hypothetical protein